MLENLRYYIVYLALLTSIIGVLYYPKLPCSKAKFLLCLVIFSFVTELVGKYFTAWTGFLNYYVYNFYMLASFSAYLILLRMLLLKLLYKRLATLFLILFLLFYFINIMFLQHDPETTFTYSFAVGVGFVLILSCLYLVEIFNSDKILNFKKSIYFWFVIGILVFHVPFLPFMLALNWFLIDKDESVFSLVLFILNLLMYICFNIGFIWSEKKYNY
jgi:hypothetical protein